MKKILRTFIIAGILSAPLVVFAQSANINQGFNTLGGAVNTFTNTIVRSLAGLFTATAMVAFFYGIVQFILGSRNGKPEVMTNGKNFMLWGLIALFVMFSVWGIVKYFQNVFGISGSNVITIPSIQTGSSGGGYDGGWSGNNPNANNNPSVFGECSNVGNGSSCAGGSGVCNNGICVYNVSGGQNPNTGNNPAIYGECSNASNGVTCAGGAGICKNKVCVNKGQNTPPSTSDIQNCINAGGVMLTDGTCFFK